jgi:hypothetical protein
MLGGREAAVHEVRHVYSIDVADHRGAPLGEIGSRKVGRIAVLLLRVEQSAAAEEKQQDGPATTHLEATHGSSEVYRFETEEATGRSLRERLEVQSVPGVSYVRMMY